MSAQPQHRRDAHYIGRCLRKCCPTIVRLTVPMVGYDTVNRPGTMWERKSIRWEPELGRYYSPHSEGIHCAHHKWQLKWKLIDGKVSEKHKCDSRCMNATGPNCECSCGGVNHGGAYDTTKLFKFNDE